MAAQILLFLLIYEFIHCRIEVGVDEYGCYEKR